MPGEELLVASTSMGLLSETVCEVAEGGDEDGLRIEAGSLEAGAETR